MNGTAGLVAENVSYENQRLYWGLAFALSFVSIVGLLYLFYESKRNRAFRTPVLQSFSIILIGDFMFTMCYLPYHSYNTIASLLGGEFQDPEDSPLCLVSWFIASSSFQVQMWGFTFLGYVPYQMITNAARLRSNVPIGRKAYAVTFIVATISELVWFISGYAYNQLGSNRGLYCATKSWANFQGFWMLFIMTISMSAFLLLFILTYRIVKQMDDSSEMKTKEGDKKRNSASRKGAKSILRFGTLLTINFVAAYGWYCITLIWNAFSPYIGSLPPLELEMVAGLGSKTKAIADVIVILSIPSVQKERNKRRKGYVAPTTAASSEQASDNTSG